MIIRKDRGRFVRAIAAAVTAVALAGCSGSAALTSVALAAAPTLGTVLAANNQDVATAVSYGQLFCKGEAGIFAALGVNVTGVPATAVADACTALDATSVPTAAPVNPAVVAVVSAAPSVISMIKAL